MSYIKTIFFKVFSLIILQVFMCQTICFSEGLDFLDTEDLQGIPTLRRDIKIPVGISDDTVHNFTLEKGTLVSEIPSKISQKRQEIGLSPHVPLEQQDTLFQDYSWQTTKHKIVKAPTSGKIIQVFVHKGQQIEKGEKLCLIEVMKMLTTVTSPSSGEITQLSFQADDLVDNNSILISLLPTSPKWEDINQTQILDSKDLLLPFFPWATSASIESNIHDPSPNNGQDKGILNARVEREDNLSMQTPQEEPLQSPSLLLMATPLPEPVQDSIEESRHIEQTPISLPVLLQGSVIEQEMEPRNLNTLDIPSLSEVSPLTLQINFNAHETSVLDKKAPFSIVEFDNKEKTDRKFEKDSMPFTLKSIGIVGKKNLVPFNSSIKKSTEENNYSLQWECSIPQSKVLLRKALTHKFDDESNFSIGKWATWIGGLIALSKLIFALTAMRHYILLRGAQYRIIYCIIFSLRKTIYLDASNFNKYRFLINQVASNMNHATWFKKKAA